MQISIFDLDHTLCRVNTSVYFGLYLYRYRILSLFSLLILAVYYFAHNLGLISMAILHKKAFQHFFFGRNCNEIQLLAQSFAKSEIPSHINPTILSRLQQARSKGEKIILLSSSPDFLVKAIAESIGAEMSAGTLYSHDTVYTSLGSIMDGGRKAEYVAGLSVSKENITGYSDSIFDLPFLEAVGVPVGVSPDSKLLRHCRSMRWEVLG